MKRDGAERHLKGRLSKRGSPGFGGDRDLLIERRQITPSVLHFMTILRVTR